MSLNILHIAEGWSKSLGIIKVTPEVEALSMQRMKICATSGKDGGHCEKASKSSLLKFLRGEVHEFDAIFCDGCGCPINEATLVTEKKCPLNRW